MFFYMSNYKPTRIRPQDVLYWNQLSGLTECFNKTDMQHAKNIEIFSMTYNVEKIVQHLLIDGSAEFSIRDNFFSTHNLLQNINAPKLKQGKIQLKDVFKIEEKTDDYIDISLTEKLSDEKEYVVGKIKLIRNATLINDVKCKAAVVIYDVIPIKPTIYTMKALGAMAMALGAYVLIKKTCDWDRIIESVTDTEKHDNYSKLLIKLSNLEKANIELTKKVQDITISYQNQIGLLKKQIRSQNKLINELKNPIHKPENIKKEVATMPDDTPSIDLNDITIQEKLCFVGGSSTWRKKIKMAFPKIHVINTTNFDESIIRNSEILVVNTNFVSHSETGKATSVAFRNGTKVIYTTKNNIKNLEIDIAKNLT